MAARKRKGLAESTRLRIKTSMLVNRLTDHVFGTVEMTSSQVRAAETLLRKTLPDLSAVHSTDNEKEQSLEDWLESLPDGEV